MFSTAGTRTESWGTSSTSCGRVKASRRSRLCGVCVLLMCVPAAMSSAQNATSEKPSCFRIQVRLNGKPIDGPEAITLRTNRDEVTVPLEKGCFSVPSAFHTEKSLDVVFSVPGNQIHLAGISIVFLSDSWGVDLQDKKFGKEFTLPKHARPRNACAVVFHRGEPEIGITQTGCRTPLKAVPGCRSY
jgi:hypothetical protein